MAKSKRKIMRVLDVLGKRWALRILWELRNDALSFRELRAAADELSPSVLNARLGELRELGVIDTGDGGYSLTKAGRELGKVLLALDTWAKKYVS